MSDFLTTPWTVVCQDPQSMRFLRQEYWSGLQFPSPGHLPKPGIQPVFCRFFTTESLGQPHILDFNFLLDIWFINIFSFIWLSFHFADAFLCSPKHLSWCHPTCSFFFLYLPEETLKHTAKTNVKLHIAHIFLYGFYGFISHI